MVERERIDSLVSKLATMALPIDGYSYNHNPPLQEQAVLKRYRASSSSIYYKISMLSPHFFVFDES
jgi:hypothetical protein